LEVTTRLGRQWNRGVVTILIEVILLRVEP
jgi:hypothetical protein